VEAVLQFIPPDRKTNAILTRDSSQSSSRRRGAVPVDRRNRLSSRPVRTVRDRADAAIISQWLSEQATTPARPPKTPAAA
jgi:hypothetical protein